MSHTPETNAIHAQCSPPMDAEQAYDKMLTHARELELRLVGEGVDIERDECDHEHELWVSKEEADKHRVTSGDDISIEFESREALCEALCHKVFGAKPTFKNEKCEAETLPDGAVDLTLPDTIMRCREQADAVTVCGRPLTQLSRDAMLAFIVWKMKQSESEIKQLREHQRKLFKL